MWRCCCCCCCLVATTSKAGADCLMTFYMSSQVKITKNTGTNSRRWMRILPYQLFVCVCVFVLVPDHKRNICECELRPADVLVRFEQQQLWTLFSSLRTIHTQTMKRFLVCVFMCVSGVCVYIGRLSCCCCCFLFESRFDISWTATNHWFLFILILDFVTLE